MNVRTCPICGCAVHYRSGHSTWCSEAGKPIAPTEAEKLPAPASAEDGASAAALEMVDNGMIVLSASAQDVAEIIRKHCTPRLTEQERAVVYLAGAVSPTSHNHVTELLAIIDRCFGGGK